MVRWLAAFYLVIIAIMPARAGVVINEIMYHAPDDLDDLQFIELHNASAQAVDLGGWKLTKSVKYEFPAGIQIAAGGFVVVCKDKVLFKKHYGQEALGPFSGKLSHSADKLELRDRAGKAVDKIQYRTRGAWPSSADGSSASLERICPTAPGDVPTNWAASPLPPQARPAGTPGQRNANFAAALPPVINSLTVSPPVQAAPGQEILVSASVAGPNVKNVELLYRVVRPGQEGPEKSVAMSRADDGKYVAKVAGQAGGQIVRLRVRATDAVGAARICPAEHDLRPAHTVWVNEPVKPGKIPFAFVIQPRGGSDSQAPRGNSAFVLVSARSVQVEVFDFINVVPRHGGRKIHFHRDRLLEDMSVINLIFEGQDRFVLAEYLAYEVYRRAGNAACKSDFVRLWVDGQPLGYQLLVEQPNKGFLRRNGVNADGHLYKNIWYGQGLVGSHEKKTREAEGHADLTKLHAELTKLRRDEQWAFIKKHFNVEQVINYFAVNMVLSHWDGYFNNYFLYHDTKEEKWTLYPWDQDKTWGFHDGMPDYQVFTNMPIRFGMSGDFPLPTAWWRPGGYFSGPLLANSVFRPLFVARLKEITEKVYTEELFFPLIDELGVKLEDEVKERARLQGGNPDRAVEHLQKNLGALKEHLTKRRKFILEQDEVKKAKPFDRSLLK